ncbi:MAG: GNAT family N-acetyltransferase [Planctomycetaceae bacterium]|nr:GNAT family N-acetyltransferase [Planctomycetaceae bacterium]
MSEHIAFRTAVAADAPQIVALIRDAFPAPLVTAMTYGCPGVADFVAEQIAVQDLGGETFYVVAADEQGLVGCAEGRRLPRRLFLSYIAVSSTIRGQGIGRRLLLALIEAAGIEADELALDVFDFNTAARRWYDRLGFESRESGSWCEASLDGGRPRPVRLIGYAQAEACHRLYGFSQFTLCTPEGQYDIGRLEARWYRLSDPAAIEAPGVLATLKRLAPERRLLLIGNASKAASSLSDAREFARSHRMAAPLNNLRKRLTERRPERAGTCQDH